MNSIDINPDEDITILVDDEEDKKSIQSFSSQKIPKISMSVENLHLENEAAYFHAQYSALSKESLNRDKKHLNETDSLTEDQEHSTLLQDIGLKSRITNGHSGSSFVKRTNSLNGSCHSDPTRSLNGSAHFSSKNSIQSSPKNCCNGHEIVELSVKEITDKKTRNVFVRCCKVIGEMSLFRLLR